MLWPARGAWYAGSASGRRCAPALPALVDGDAVMPLFGYPPAVNVSQACRLSIRAFDFEAKVEREIEVEDLRAERDAGHFVWVDADVTDRKSAREFLSSLGLADAEVIQGALGGAPTVHQVRFDDYLYLVLAGCRLEDGTMQLERLDVVVGDGYMLSFHTGSVQFLEALLKEYHADFVLYAKSPSFLMYELWDHLTDNWVAAHAALSSQVSRLQEKLIHRFDDSVFGRVAELNSDLLELRKILVPAREVLSELASRRSPFISDETSPFLANMAGTVARIVQDLNVDRDILSDSVALYMSMISYRTNRVMTRLTVVSVVFLPLMFLCGVYGMNFRVLPETTWKFGYLFFWILALTITGGLIALLRRASRP